MAKKKASKSKPKEQSIFSTLIKCAWILLICGLLMVAAIFVLVSYSKMPDTEELENPNYEAASILYSINEKQIGKYFSENRTLITHDQLNPYLVDALVSTEDERYYSHSGVDAKGTMRAIVYMGGKGGASTITQQLAKLFFTKRSSSFIKRVWQKLKEWVIAIEFERRYTKEEILAMYLNKFDYLYDSHGVSAAAETYFGKNQKDLSLDEAAILVGMLKNPDAYNPKKYPENATRRRNVVMHQMVKNKRLAREDYDKLKEREIDMSKFKRSVHFEGMAPYFRTTCTKFLKKLLEKDELKKADGTKYDIYNDGLKIYTTIDEKMQKHAEETMVMHMSKVQDKYFKRWENKDPWTYSEEEDSELKKKQINYRKDFLKRAMRESERYKRMRNYSMTKISAKIKAAYPDARLWDADINRMMKEEKQPGYLKKLIREDFISRKQSQVYADILKDPLWKDLKTSRLRLEEKARKVFNKKTKMKVFAFTPSGEKEVRWTPMDSIKYHQEHLQIGSVAMDPKTGFVKAWVGGINNKYFKIDHVKTDNQVGSTFKPFLYATVISQQALSPCTKFQDIKHQIPAGDPNFGLLKTWSPDNADKKNTGAYITMKEGLKLSKNSISVALIKQLGNVNLIRDLVDRMGINKSKIPQSPSIVLGASDLNVLEMTGAYSSFANNGLFIEPTFISRIENKDGRVIYSAVPQTRKVMGEKYNYAVINLLEYASSAHTHKLKSQWGGKTGTTNDYIDGWFMGISPELVVGTWVGGENSWIRFLHIWEGSGGAMARPFYIDFMKKLENDPNIRLNEGQEFQVPEGDMIVLDCSLYEQKIPSKEEKDKAVKIKVLNDEGFEEEFQ